MIILLNKCKRFAVFAKIRIGLEKLALNGVHLVFLVGVLAVDQFAIRQPQLNHLELFYYLFRQA